MPVTSTRLRYARGALANPTLLPSHLILHVLQGYEAMSWISGLIDSFPVSLLIGQSEDSRPCLRQFKPPPRFVCGGTKWAGFATRTRPWNSGSLLRPLVNTRLLPALISLFALTACAEESRFSGSNLAQEHLAMIERNTIDYMLANPETDGNYNGQLREAAFNMVEGLSAKQAVAIFEADGAACQDRKCTWTHQDRETVWGAGRRPCRACRQTGRWTS